MNVVFTISAAVAVISTVLAVSRLDAVHALLYLIVSLLSVALVFLTLGAPFVAALEVIIYAGAIMVLFIFVVMMLNLGARAAEQERAWLRPRTWVLPSILAMILIGELVYVLGIGRGEGAAAGAAAAGTGPRQVGMALFGPYVLGVELASMLLLAGLVGAYHLGRPSKPNGEEGRGS